MRVIISAGGTGGHIYPALAIISKLKEEEKDLEVLYIGTHNRMEKDLVPKRGIPYESLEIYGFSKKDIKRDVKNIFLIRKCYKKCLEIMKNFKPDVVIGVGGYVTYPVIKAAHKLKIKSIIHEQNSIPGKSNKVLAKYVDKIFVSFMGSKDYFPKDKVVFTGNPCAENALKIKAIEKTELGFKKEKKLVVIVAGSLGSYTINQKMKEFLEECGKEDFQVLYITGKDFYEEFKENKFGSNIKVVPYLDNLAGLLKNTDLIITRAGASTISEIMALRVPAIFIPSPYVANNHQYYNALELKNGNGADLIEEKDLNKDVLMSKVLNILNNDANREVIRENLKGMGCNDSLTRIYSSIKEVIGWKK